jgi:hypothetical protein
MNRLRWVLVITLLALVGWWLLRPSPEDRIRATHQNLEMLLRKTNEDAPTPSILDVLAFQALFAEQVRVTGDDLRGSYTAEDMARLIVRARASYRTLDPAFGELAITLLAPDLATATFDAVLDATPGNGDAPFREQRHVTTELWQVEGNWVISAIELAQ